MPGGRGGIRRTIRFERRGAGGSGAGAAGAAASEAVVKHSSSPTSLSNNCDEETLSSACVELVCVARWRCCSAQLLSPPSSSWRLL